MDSRREPFDNLCCDVAEQLAIGGAEEDVLAMIAAQRDVIERAGDMNAKRSWHPSLPVSNHDSDIKVGTE
jgi:hypothetical protein